MSQQWKENGCPGELCGIIHGDQATCSVQTQPETGIAGTLNSQLYTLLLACFLSIALSDAIPRTSMAFQSDTVSLVFTTDLYFLIKWLDSDDTLYDTIPFRDITAPEGLDVLSLLPGETCQASFAGQLYDAEVVAVGMYTVDINIVYTHLLAYIYQFIC